MLGVQEFKKVRERRSVSEVITGLAQVKQVAPKKFNQLHRKFKGQITRNNHSAIIEETIKILGGAATKGNDIEGSHAAILARKPEGAVALVVAQFEEDKGDAASGQYVRIVTTRTMALGWRFTERENFDRLLELAKLQEETKHLTHKHVRKEYWKGGVGAYVKAGSRHDTGWAIRSVELKDIPLLGVIEDKLGVEGSNVEAQPSKVTLEVKENKDKQSIELHFSRRPSNEVVAQLQARHWLFSRRGAERFYYNLVSPENQKFADQLAKLI